MFRWENGQLTINIRAIAQWLLGNGIELLAVGLAIWVALLIKQRYHEKNELRFKIAPYVGAIGTFILVKFVFEFLAAVINFG